MHLSRFPAETSRNAGQVAIRPAAPYDRDVVRPVASVALLTVLAGHGLACNGVPNDSTGAETTASSTFALVSIQRSSSGVSPTPRVELVARFVRSRAEATATFAALGSSLGMPQLGMCAPLSSLAATSDDSTGPIELLDVGRVEVASGDTANASRQTVLEPRELPNLGDFARGTFYALAASSDATPGARYDVKVGGSNDFGPLFVSGIAPQEPSHIAFNGVVATGSSINLSNARALRITWMSDDTTANTANDIVYVDTSDATSHETMRCAFADTGVAEVPPPAGERGQVEVHRLRRHAATPTTELRFDFYRSFTFAR